MDDNNILNETTDGKTFDWNSFLEASEAETNSSDYNWNIDFDEWPDEWAGDREDKWTDEWTR